MNKTQNQNILGARSLRGDRWRIRELWLLSFVLVGCDAVSSSDDTEYLGEEPSSIISSNDISSVTPQASSLDSSFNLSDPTPQIVVGDASLICMDSPYTDRDGNIQTGGTKRCTVADCTSSGQVDCATTNQFKSFDYLNLSEGNIKSGVTIAGITGRYPSASYGMDSCSFSVADLTSATFNSQIKSSARFRYFGSDGECYESAGDADIVGANIVSRVSIFGTTGTAVTSSGSVNAWDLRAGVTLNGVSGSLKTSCPNEDSCGGEENTVDDFNVWRDITTDSSGVPSSCSASNCIMRDKITQLSWRLVLPSDPMGWAASWQICGGFDIVNPWRLPTQKELMEAYTHGIKSVLEPSAATLASSPDGDLWSGTTDATHRESQTNAWTVNLWNGNVITVSKSHNTRNFFCVR